MMIQPEIDPREFRSALGKFPTGVTIITTKNDNDEYIGITASSFNSVSLNPPLILWSIDKNARSLSSFPNDGHYAVHVLNEQQQELSNTFARQGADKFSGLEVTEGIAGVPLLAGVCGRFQCKCEHQYDGGDHIIMVGRVLNYETCDNHKPLVFHSGNYARVTYCSPLK
ncbi:flavin reductase family protein [Thalassotalea mangrovi]|uniref:Flavin reductase family protein n=2 Tax=Thalassotalea mangrovi TaxID=2572245 RepID=A0A4U1B6M1_9GAMM|nr:flavin reductase family protein [Thalassotalea mangrovi]